MQAIILDGAVLGLNPDLLKPCVILHPISCLIICKVLATSTMEKNNLLDQRHVYQFQSTNPCGLMKKDPKKKKKKNFSYLVETPGFRTFYRKIACSLFIRGFSLGTPPSSRSLEIILFTLNCPQLGLFGCRVVCHVSVSCLFPREKNIINL